LILGLIFMIALDIHVENLNPKDFFNGDKTKIISDILEDNIPVALSFSPWQEPIWKDQNPVLFELFKEAVNRENSVLGQQGLNHKCKYGHTLADPWHENYCLWNEKLNYDQQIDFMTKGKNRLEEIFEKEVELYVPPNHQFDKTTLEVAADMGYKLFADKAMISLKSYKFGNMLIVPERDLEDGKFDCDAVYIHYDEIDIVRDNYDEVVGNVIPLRYLNSKEVSKYSIKVNDILKYSYKFLRDGRRTMRKFSGKTK